MGQETRLLDPQNKKKKKSNTGKAVAFVSVGGLTLIYCIAELGAALYLGSLTLLSDGFHNLSDVVSLYIAYWAQNAAQRDLSNEMSYGWARTEILGGLTNGCFLLSLCLYVSLEAVPKLIHPDKSEELAAEDGGYMFIIIATAGLILNIIGTIVFGVVGISHGHSHSHGHGHGHGHGHKDASVSPNGPASPGSINDDDSEHEHSHKKKDKKDKKEHGHEHGHAHKDKKDKKDKKEHGHEHAHAHKDKSGKHKHDKEHDHKHDKEEHKGHDSHKRNKLTDMDVNTWAVFIHFLGDAVSSLFVLGTGLLLHFFDAKWTSYIDPVSSLLIVILIVSTTVPLVKRCSMILLQSVPTEVDLDAVRAKTATVFGVVSVHDLHVWQLVDGMIIASVHLMIEEGVDVGNVVYQVKQIFHSFGIHSSAIQPEFVKLPLQRDLYCAQNCVEECEEDWCCKKTADKTKDIEEHYSTFNDSV